MPDAASPLQRPRPDHGQSAVARVKAEAARLPAPVILGSCAFGLFGAVLVLAALQLGPGSAATAAAIVAGTSGLAGHMVGHRHGPLPGRVQTLLYQVSDELGQYRAFTSLLRAQGLRITGVTSDAAGTIVSGLTDMDSRLTSLVNTLESGGAEINRHQLATTLRGIAEPVIDMLSALQFQDVTQQQIDFLSRLSLLLDDHMIQLSRQLGDRRAMERIGGFKALFEQALDHSVMDSQRDDHHAASGSALREAPALKIELF